MAPLPFQTPSPGTADRGFTGTVERDTVSWDRELTGFGVRIHPTGGKVYVAQARGPNGQKRVTVGRHPLIGAEQARQRAALIITRIKAGEDPVPLPLAAKFAGGPTVTDLARRYLEEHVAVRCKPKTARTARSVVNRHIVPALGRLPLAAVERQHVMELHERLCETPAMANMTVATLTHMYALARGRGMAPEDCDPCRSIPMNPKRSRDRFMTHAEFTRLGQVLDEVSGADRMRGFAAFPYAAGSWGRERRVVARLEASARGFDARYIVTSLSAERQHLYEGIYCARGQA